MAEKNEDEEKKILEEEAKKRAKQLEEVKG